MEQPLTRLDGLSAGRARTPYIHALVGALILAWFLAYNGWPVFYEDTSAYLTRPGRVLGNLGLDTEWNPLRRAPHAVAAGDAAEGAGNFRNIDDNPSWLAGRSVYYGTTMVLIAALTGTFGIALLQGYLCALAIAIPWFRLGGGPLGYVATLALLAALTGVAVIAATLTPDIFLPIAILASATLAVAWRRLLRIDKVVLALVLCFAAMAHDSILALVLACSILSLAALLHPAMRATGRRFAPIWLAGIAGLLGLAAFALAAQMASGRPPLNLPHLTARTATSAEGREVLGEQCPRADLAVCRFQPQVRRGDWITFMFSEDPATAVFSTAPIETQYALADEQLAVLLLVARERPLAFAQRQVRDVARQLTRFTLVDFDVSRKRSLQRMLSPELLARVNATRSNADRGRVLAILSALGRASAAAGLAFILVRFVSFWYRRRPTEAELIALLLLFGVLLNAFICATLAGVYDRFQARVIWLVPLAAAIIIGTLRGADGLKRD